MTCRHNQPPELCPDCKTEAARWSAQADERQRILSILQRRTEQTHNREVRAALVTLMHEIK